MIMSKQHARGGFLRKHKKIAALTGTLTALAFAGGGLVLASPAMAGSCSDTGDLEIAHDSPCYVFQYNKSDSDVTESDGADCDAAEAALDAAQAQENRAKTKKAKAAAEKAYNDALHMPCTVTYTWDDGGNSSGGSSSGSDTPEPTPTTYYAELYAVPNWGNYTFNNGYEQLVTSDWSYNEFGTANLQLSDAVAQAQMFNRTGYHIDYWSTKADGSGTKYTYGQTVPVQYGNTVYLYAHWVKDGYKITFDPNGGTFTNPSDATRTVDDGKAIGNMPTPTWSGHKFVGWSKKGDNAIIDTTWKPTADTKLVANWTIPTQVTFDPAGGTLANNDYFNDHGDRSKPFTKEFDSLGDSSEPLEVDFTLDGKVNNSQSPYATRPGYTFLGWKTSDGAKFVAKYSDSANTELAGFEMATEDSGNWTELDSDAGFIGGKYYKPGTPVTLTAMWKKSTFTITARANGGTFPDGKKSETIQVKDGQKASFPTPTRKGYTFSMWRESEGEPKDLNTWIPISDATIFAYWTPNDNDLTMTVHYNGAGTLDPDDNIQKATVPTDQLPHQFADVATPVVQGYLADKAKVAGMKADLDNPNPSATVTYRKSGNIVPVDQDGNPIPGASKPYKTDPSDPTKIVPNQPLPDVPGYKPADGSKTVKPTDPTKDTQVTYKHIAKIQDLPSAGSAMAWLVAIPLLGLIAGAVALALRKKA